MNKASFSRHLGEGFRESLNSSEQIELVLIEVKEFSKPGQDPGSEPKDHSEIRNEPFTVLFRGPHEPFLRSKIRELEHDQMVRSRYSLFPWAGTRWGSTTSRSSTRAPDPPSKEPLQKRAEGTKEGSRDIRTSFHEKVGTGIADQNKTQTPIEPDRPVELRHMEP